MQVSAKLTNVRLSPQKCRLVIDQIRGLPVGQAIDSLSYSNKKGAALVKKVLNSAIANAEHNEGADIDELNVTCAFVDEGPIMKRFRARARGRGAKILKRMCHITITVSDE